MELEEKGPTDGHDEPKQKHIVAAVGGMGWERKRRATCE